MTGARDKIQHMLQNAVRRSLKPFQPDWRVRLQQNITREIQRGTAVNQTCFPTSLSLPEEYGRGLPERVVELLLAYLLYQPGRQILDVGHANAMQCHLELIEALPAPKNIIGIDIAQPVFNWSKYYKHSICGDITNTGLEDNRFLRIWCVSALEHFGMDNSGYTKNYSIDSLAPTRALREMLRILQPGGQILITVPFGKYENNRWFINYDSERWHSLLETARPVSIIHELYFRHTFNSGWSAAAPDELRNVGYYDQANSGAGALAAAIIVKDM